MLCNPNRFEKDNLFLHLHELTLCVCSPGCLSTDHYTYIAKLSDCPQSFEIKHSDVNKDCHMKSTRTKGLDDSRWLTAGSLQCWPMSDYCYSHLLHLTVWSSILIHCSNIPGLTVWPPWPRPCSPQVLCGIHTGVPDTPLYSGEPATHTLDALHYRRLQSVCGVWTSRHAKQ